MFFRGPVENIFFYNFADVIKFMVLFHLQRIRAHSAKFSILKKNNLKNVEKDLNFFLSNFKFSYNCLLFYVLFFGNR